MTILVDTNVYAPKHLDEVGRPSGAHGQENLRLGRDISSLA